MPTVRTQPRTIPPIPNSPPPGAIIFPRQSATSRNPQDLFANILKNSPEPFFLFNLLWNFSPISNPAIETYRPRQKANPIPTQKAPGHDLSHTRVLPILCPVITV